MSSLMPEWPESPMIPDNVRCFRSSMAFEISGRLRERVPASEQQWGTGVTRYPQVLEQGLGLTVQGIMAGPVIETGFAGVDFYAGFQHKAADIVNAAAENLLHVHLVQGLPAGAAAHHAGVKGKISQHFPDLAEDNGVLQHLPALGSGLGIHLGRISAA